MWLFFSMRLVVIVLSFGRFDDDSNDGDDDSIGDVL